jgi:two-component system alkaline phosphatase synthesis response regulator PhoP
LVLEVNLPGSKREARKSDARVPEILVLEDEENIGVLIREILIREGMKVCEVSEVEVAQEKIRSCAPDLLILNMTLPKLSRLELCRWVRSNERNEDLPILIVSGEAGSADRVLGLQSGADDYLTEPFRPDEITARVKALLRRSRIPAEGRPGPSYQHGRLRVNFATRQVFVDDKERYLPLKQFELLAFLVRNPYRVFTRQRLIDSIWGERGAVAYRTVNVAVRRLRKQIERDDSKPTLIVTVRDVGYRFNPDG